MLRGVDSGILMRLFTSRQSKPHLTAIVLKESALNFWPGILLCLYPRFASLYLTARGHKSCCYMYTENINHGEPEALY